jgi:ComF family protein
MLQAINPIFDFFLPRICPACETQLNGNEYFVCEKCLSQITFVDEDRIKKEFSRKFADKNIISDFAALYVFEKDRELQQIIHALKYTNKFLIGNFLGKEMGKNLSEKIRSWNIDLIISVPLHHLKKVDRGYNQAFYIAKGLGSELKIKVSESAVKRVKFTQSQTTMNYTERQENMGNAFKVKNRNKIAGKNLLLIDDVITTGATTSECAKVLLSEGANKVYAAFVAITDYDN